jgi:hypothetical protein
MSVSLESLRFAGLLAVHFKTCEDIDLFELVVASIVEQTKPLSVVAVGMSAEDAVYQRCVARVAEWRVLFDSRSIAHYLVLAPCGTKRSQFEHYHALNTQLGTLGDHQDLWLLFGDADDLWGPRRVELNNDFVLRRAPGKVAFISSFYSVDQDDARGKRKSTLNSWVDHYVVCPDGDDCAHVDLCPQSVRHFVQANIGHTPVEGAGFEYFTACVLFAHFDAFFQSMETFDQSAMPGGKLTKSKFCDLAFGSFIFKSNNWWYDEVRGDWLYLKVERSAGENNTMIEGGGFDGQLQEAHRIHAEKVRAANFPDVIDLSTVPYEPACVMQ